MDLWINDSRGKSCELIEFLKVRGCNSKFDQIFLSRSKRGVFRGLHHQEATPQTKTIFILEGIIDDYLLDLSLLDNPSLSADQYMSHRMLRDQEGANFLIVPSDKAHGYYVRSDTALILYLISGRYDARLQRQYKVRRNKDIRQFIERHSQIAFDDTIISHADF